MFKKGKNHDVLLVSTTSFSLQGVLALNLLGVLGVTGVD